MPDDFRFLLEDIDLVIKSKAVDLKSSLMCLMTRGESLKIELCPGAINGLLQHIAEIQERGKLIDRICEELMTMLTVRKRIQIHAAAACSQTPCSEDPSPVLDDPA